MGGVDKARLRLGNRPLLDWCAERLAPQVDSLRIARAPDDAPLPGDYPVLPDRADGPSGPAAGLWSLVRITMDASSETRVATSAVDTPLLPGDFVQRGAEMLAASPSVPAVVGCFGNTPYYTQAVWRLGALRTALDGAESNAPAVRHLLGMDWLALSYETGENPFANINTLADLRRLGRRFT